jgi:hypothetical protein
MRMETRPAIRAQHIPLQFARKKELTKTAVVRQALRLFQMVDARLSQGEKLIFEDEMAKKKAELMVL